MHQDHITETSQHTTRGLPIKTHCSTAVVVDAKPQCTSTSASVTGKPRHTISANVWRKQALIFC
ncbi:hypothetical protein CSPAE12_03752 [Colletotrichum incanum]|nr:hypothetical protein CSPAE12_03752 [Colletotrichum incanum]